MQVTQLFSQYVVRELEEHAKAPNQTWQSKDCAIYLVVALTVQVHPSPSLLQNMMSTVLKPYHSACVCVCVRTCMRVRVRVRVHGRVRLRASYQAM